MTTLPPGPPGSRSAPVVVNGYELLAKLGEGGMGVVHLARRPGEQRVALKVLRPHIVGDDEARRRLAREVGSLEKIRSAWVAEILDADPWGDVPYVATRYVPGLSLHDFVVEEGAITGPDLNWFAACLAEGIASVHASGVLHRDVKPSNVLMEGRTPILIDFGLARVADDPRLTHTGWLLGTPGYLAPEILYGEDATTASDLHSWAATVAYAGTGRPPFGRGPAMAIMDRVRRGEHELSGLPDDIGAVVAAALAPDPARRPSLEQILDWLRPQTTRAGAPVPALADAVPQTMPLVALHRDAVDASTDVLSRAGTRPYTAFVPAAPGLQEKADGDLWADPEQIVDLDEPRPPLAERARRATLLVGAAEVCGLAVAAYPWVATLMVMLLVWVLRSGSMAASAVGERRLARGRRWYDGARFLFSAPLHLVRSIPSTLLLQLWGLGIAASGALVCYAVATSLTSTLMISGVLLAVGCWFGPGGSRVRGPVSRVTRAASASTGTWAVALVAVLVMALGAGLLVAAGTDWTPAQRRPMPGHDLSRILGVTP